MATLNESELQFVVHQDGDQYTICIDKIGGGTLGHTYSHEQWEWTAYSESGDAIQTATDVFSAESSHFDVGAQLAESINNGDIILPDWGHEEAVAEGIQLLRRIFGTKWLKMIDLDTLDLNDGCNCVLGQIFSGYGVGVDVMRAYHGELNGVEHEDDHFDFAVEHGFATNGSYVHLTKLWKESITELRGQQ